MQKPEAVVPPPACFLPCPILPASAQRHAPAGADSIRPPHPHPFRGTVKTVPYSRCEFPHVPVGAGLDPPAVLPVLFAERSRPFPTADANFRTSLVGRGLAPAAISRTDHKCAARPEAGLAHGNNQGERSPQITEDGNPKGRAALCKALPVGVPFFRFFPHERKESAPGGMDTPPNPAGATRAARRPGTGKRHPSKTRGTVKTVPYGPMRNSTCPRRAGACPRRDFPHRSQLRGTAGGRERAR